MHKGESAPLQSQIRYGVKCILYGLDIMEDFKLYGVSVSDSIIIVLDMVLKCSV